MQLSRISDELLQTYSPHIDPPAAQNGGIVSHAIYKAANAYRKAYNNLNYDMQTNGEYRLLDLLVDTNVRTVFDVGANKGDYTNACLARFRNAKVHAFEIAPPTFAKLKSNVNSERAILNMFGLSNAVGTLRLNFSPDDDGSSSLVEGQSIHGGNWTAMEVEVIRGDEYCRSAAIDHIDLLKVDVEGAEHLVFDGFSDLFRQDRIAAVQFEFGMINIYSKVLLRDFYELFEGHSFAIGPLMPTGVLFRDYDTRFEDFQGPPNYVAVHKSRKDLLEALQRR